MKYEVDVQRIATDSSPSLNGDSYDIKYLPSLTESVGVDHVGYLSADAPTVPGQTGSNRILYRDLP